MRLAWTLLGAALLSAVAQAKLVEEQFDLPVAVIDGYGKVTEQAIKLTVFFDDQTPAPRPLLLLNHGRAAEAVDRANFGRARYTDNSRWFAKNGFTVALPTRVGYGVSAGPDLEDTGACDRKAYPPAYAAAAQQVRQALAFMLKRPDVLPDRSVVVGQSFGGATTITLLADPPAGVLAGINFAGGGGGNPKTQPGRPCSPARLEQMFATYGKTAKLPTLWVYTENDLFMGPKHPREWFDAFQKAGGNGRFMQFPPNGEDGHSLFTAAPAVWRPLVVEFLNQQGFALKEAP
ncbi:hypothetical protein BurJ1DRAFT_4741 [Burkholderiales bacterium JOSHI_001]|nr:hypothetical protein BurJ1DRAFT_4741 [Burkholderiales bacterium JOSHI_001]